MSARRLRETLSESVLGTLFLRLLSGFYWTGVLLRNAAYSAGLLPSRKLEARVVCIGNLTTGGTGKTPAVLLAAQTLHENGVKTAILSRGYKRPGGRASEVIVVQGSASHSWEEVGDEPWMMHRALKGCDMPILVGSDRVQSGETAIKYYSPQVLLLDDGFQHRRLQRDADIVLLNAQDPFGGGRLLPLGDLREPPSSLRRASIVVLTHADRVPRETLDALAEQVRLIRSDLPVLEAVHRPDMFLDLKTEETRPLSHLQDKEAACLSGLGDPRSFEESVRSVGVTLTQTWRFPDHYAFSQDDLQSIENVRRGLPLLTTMKDFPRLPAGWKNRLGGEVLALLVRLEIVSGKDRWDSALLGR